MHQFGDYHTGAKPNQAENPRKTIQNKSERQAVGYA